MGELASNFSDTGAGKLPWLIRLSLNGSADISLVLKLSQSCRLHDYSERPSKRERSVQMSTPEVDLCCVSREFLSCKVVTIDVMYGLH